MLKNLTQKYFKATPHYLNQKVSVKTYMKPNKMSTKYNGYIIEECFKLFANSAFILCVTSLQHHSDCGAFIALTISCLDVVEQGGRASASMHAGHI